MRRQAGAVGAAGVVLAMAVALAACGDDDDGAAGTAAGSGGETEQVAGAGSGDFCEDLETVITHSAELMTALLSGDAAAVQAVAESPLPAATAAVEASAPADLAEDVGAVSARTGELLRAIEGASGGGEDELEAALADVPANDPAVNEAEDRINEYARTACGFDPEAAMDDVGFPESPEPPDPCTLVDPAIPASAAGVEVDTSGGNDTADFDLGVFAIRGCVYERGTMVLSTVTFPGSVAEVVDVYVSSTEDQGGTATTDFDKGDLPDSTLITTAGGTATITVFEAPTPFSVGFRDVSDPATLVDAADAVLAATG